MDKKVLPPIINYDLNRNHLHTYNVFFNTRYLERKFDFFLFFGKKKSNKISKKH